MLTLNQIIDEVTSKYGLGSQGGPLVRELHALVTGGQGGIGRFIDRLKGAGLGNLRRGRAGPMPRRCRFLRWRAPSAKARSTASPRSSAFPGPSSALPWPT